MAAGTAEENLHSPRVSWANGGDIGDIHQYAEDLAAGVTSSLHGQHHQQQQQPHNAAQSSQSNQSNMAVGQHQQDPLAIAQNGGQEADDADMDGDADDGMDDDMMDKISSSPSIEDGGSTYTLPIPRAPTRPSLPPTASLCSQPAPALARDLRSSAPYLERHSHAPLRSRPLHSGEPLDCYSVCHHHLSGEYLNAATATAAPDDDEDVPLPIAAESKPPRPRPYRADETDATEDDSFRDPIFREVVAELRRLEQAPPYLEDAGWAVRREGPGRRRIGPAADPFSLRCPHDVDEQAPAVPDDYDDDDDLMVPYESDEDDDGDIPFDLYDSRLIDSGWGGECLQETEDIDFEFVYALHTFVATVEGQANATKGDTMVLLDDSNSYWWLVRVVKDSSIGKSADPKRPQAYVKEREAHETRA